MADKYGPAFTIQLGFHRALLVSSWEMAKECFTTNDLAVTSRPQLVATKHMCYNSPVFGFAPYGSFWRELRKIATLELKEINKPWVCWDFFSVCYTRQIYIIGCIVFTGRVWAVPNYNLNYIVNELCMAVNKLISSLIFYKRYFLVKCACWLELLMSCVSYRWQRIGLSVLERYFLNSPPQADGARTNQKLVTQ